MVTFAELPMPAGHTLPVQHIAAEEEPEYNYQGAQYEKCFVHMVGSVAVR